MDLIKLKLRGLGKTVVTNWCDLSPGLNLFDVPDPAARRPFIDAVQTINPPFDCRISKPFGDFPTSITRDGYTRHIQPHRRTIAIGVFSTTPSLVGILAEISPLFYEMDRVEIGRRLDYSRWLNYVELASSTRWAEVSQQMWRIFERRGDGDQGISDLLSGLAPTDRVKGTVLAQLVDWLERLSAPVAEKEKIHYKELIEVLRRADIFTRARAVTVGYLPCFFSIDLSQPLPTDFLLTEQNPLSFLLGAFASLARLDMHGTPPDAEEVVQAVNSALATHAPDLEVQIKENKSVYRIYQDGTVWRPSPEASQPEDHLLHVKILNALHQALYATTPILLVHDGADLGQNQEELYGVLLEMASLCQCLYFPSDSSCMEEFPGAKLHGWEDVLAGTGAPR